MAAWLRTLRCFDTCGCCNPNRSVISPTVRGPSRNNSTIFKRCGSVRAVHSVFMILLYPKRNIPVKEYSYRRMFWSIKKTHSSETEIRFKTGQFLRLTAQFFQEPSTFQARKRTEDETHQGRN